MLRQNAIPSLRKTSIEVMFGINTLDTHSKTYSNLHELPIMCSFLTASRVRICFGSESGRQDKNGIVSSHLNRCNIVVETFGSTESHHLSLWLFHLETQELKLSISFATFLLTLERFRYRPRTLFSQVAKQLRERVTNLRDLCFPSNKSIQMETSFDRIFSSGKDQGLSVIISLPIFISVLQKGWKSASKTIFDGKVSAFHISKFQVLDPLLKLIKFTDSVKPIPLRFWSQESRDLVRRSRWCMPQSCLRISHNIQIELFAFIEKLCPLENALIPQRSHSAVVQEIAFAFLKKLMRGSYSQQVLRLYVKRKRCTMTRLKCSCVNSLYDDFRRRTSRELYNIESTDGYQLGYDTIIIDRRGNPGGYQSSASNVETSQQKARQTWLELGDRLPSEARSDDALDEFIPAHEKDILFGDSQGVGHENAVGKEKCLATGTPQITAQHLKSIPLVVPTKLTCSSWSIQVASFGLQAFQAVWFVPPLLSLIPSLVILANSHLSVLNHDYRIAVICVGNQCDLNLTYNMFRSCLDDSISIDIASIENMSRSAISCTGRIVIVNDFSLLLSGSFSLLIILISVPTLTGTTGPHFSRAKLSVAEISKWKSIRSIAIAPANPWTGIQAYSSVAEIIALQLDVTRAVYIAETGDVAYALSAAQPGIHPVKPGRDACLFCEIIEKECKQYIGGYNAVVQREGRRVLSTLRSETKDDCTAQSAHFVADVNIQFLKAYLGQLEFWDEECEKVARVFDLYQTRSYALCDGFLTAVEYAQNCAELNPSRGDLWETILTSARKIKPSIFSNEAGPARLKLRYGSRGSYRMGVVVKECIRRAQNAMANEPATVRRVHGRDRFSPAVVTDTFEACDRLQECELYLCLDDESFKTSGINNDGYKVPVFHRDDVKRMDDSGTYEAITEFVQNADEYSHVFHVTNDSCYGVPDYVLPVKLLELAYAGRTNLSRVIIDERGIVSVLWENEEILYTRLKIALVATGFKTTSHPEFIVETSLDQILCELSEVRSGNVLDLTMGSIDTGTKGNTQNRISLEMEGQSL